MMIHDTLKLFKFLSVMIVYNTYVGNNKYFVIISFQHVN